MWYFAYLWLRSTHSLLRPSIVQRLVLSLLPEIIRAHPIYMALFVFDKCKFIVFHFSSSPLPVKLVFSTSITFSQFKLWEYPQQPAREVHRASYSTSRDLVQNLVEPSLWCTLKLRYPFHNRESFLKGDYETNLARYPQKLSQPMRIKFIAH